MTDFIKKLYQTGINSTSNPFLTWLKKNNEGDLLENYLKEALKNKEILAKPSEHYQILDVGCSWGPISFRLIKALQENQFNFTYYALEPFAEQLAHFQKLAVGLHNIKFINSSLEDFASHENFDLVFTSHSLYYVNELSAAVAKLLQLGQEIMIVHQGPNGINIIHREFSEHLKTNYNINLTYHDLHQLIKKLSPASKIKIYELHSEIDVSECKHARSRSGQNLISFFMDQDYQNMPLGLQKKIHLYFQQNYPHTLSNDSGIILVRH